MHWKKCQFIIITNILEKLITCIQQWRPSTDLTGKGPVKHCPLSIYIRIKFGDKSIYQIFATSANVPSDALGAFVPSLIGNIAYLNSSDR